jgi:DNA polymerase-4
MPTFAHVDMDAFFVSVEELFDPSLKGKPVVVGGQRDERGVVAAASYAARKFGVHSAMPLRTAAKLCPQAIFVDGHMDRYVAMSHRVRELLLKFSPVVEMASIDEAYLDLTGTGRLHGPPLEAAHALHQQMKRELSLNCSIGVAGSRLAAKMMSDLAKPNGVLCVQPGAEAAMLAPLPVRRIPGVGKVTEKSLHELGIFTVGHLAARGEHDLESRFGKWGTALAGKARGEDAGGWFDEELGADDTAKSIGHEHTFSEDTADAAQLESALARLTEMTARRLRENALHARTVHLKIRYTDFSTFTRAHTLERPSDLDTVLFEAARALFRANWRRGETLRLLGVRCTGLLGSPDQPQLELLDQGNQQRWKQALEAADRLRDRFGESAVGMASAMKTHIRERTHENPAERKNFLAEDAEKGRNAKE